MTGCSDGDELAANLSSFMHTIAKVFYVRLASISLIIITEQTFAKTRLHFSRSVDLIYSIAMLESFQKANLPLFDCMRSGTFPKARPS
jgi:hypothetical protein